MRALFGCLGLLGLLASVWAQGVIQPFTYQGYLRQGSAPLNDPSQSMQFRIYDALTGGTLLWNSGALTVNVSNGLFTVQLNPPISVWTGADRFLEIQVGATTLTPRVRLGATPYANTSTQLNMFQTGISNPDRMVITHSPSFSDWGLQYRDSDDSIHFLRAGATQVRIGLVDGNVGIGTASPAAKLDVNGTARVRVLQIVGADLAEKFPTTETLEPGTVVEIDPEIPGHLRKARGAYNRRVAGVVAGANGLSEGIILGNLEGSESHTPIAMSGRVWVHADATHEAIEQGDLLTTSDLPGHAMKASDPTRAHGTVIGKAMTRLEKGKTGMVLVLVNLQ